MTSRWDRPAPVSSGGIGTQWLRWAFFAITIAGMSWFMLGFSHALGQDSKATPAPTAPAPTTSAQPETPAAPVTPAPTTPASPRTTNFEALPSFIDLFNTSPVINGIIIGLSIIALLLFIYYLLTINHATIVPAAFLDELMKMVLERDYKQAVEFCRHHRTIFISTVIQRCIENIGREHSVLMSIADSEGKRRADILWNRISYLADISNVSPMLGLLGTIVGMMGAFFGLDQTTLDARSKFISGNIAGAMATTYFGLIVAIAALIFHSIIKGRLTRVLSEAEQAVHAVTDHMKRGEA